MRALALLLTLAIVPACAPAAQSGGTVGAGASVVAPAPLAGSYLLSQINGRNLPTASPGEPNVTVTRGRLVLEPSGGFTMTLTGHTESQTTPREVMQTGAYIVSGNTLTLTPAQGDPVQYQFSPEGTDLVLRDPRADVWRFARL